VRSVHLWQDDGGSRHGISRPSGEFFGAPQVTQVSLPRPNWASSDRRCHSPLWSWYWSRSCSAVHSRKILRRDLAGWMAPARCTGCDGRWNFKGFIRKHVAQHDQWSSSELS